MEFSEAYKAVHNLIYQFEALQHIREHLEKAREVETFIESSKQDIEAYSTEIEQLKEMVDSLKAEASDRREAMEKADKKKVEEVVAKIKSLWDNYHSEKEAHSKKLSSEIDDKELELSSLYSAIKVKNSQDKELTQLIKEKKEELRKVQNSLSEIKQSIGA